MGRRKADGENPGEDRAAAMPIGDCCPLPVMRMVGGRKTGDDSLEAGATGAGPPLWPPWLPEYSEATDGDLGGLEPPRPGSSPSSASDAASPLARNILVRSSASAA